MLSIKRADGSDDRIGEFINREFTAFATESEVALNYEEFTFVAEEDGELVGVLTGRAYYNEVHIGDLIIKNGHRRGGIGKMLVEEVEKTYSGSGYEKLALTTFGFQAPGFYGKLGFKTEFVREDKDPKLKKYFLIKALK